jgi:hypothetical protein
MSLRTAKSRQKNFKAKERAERKAGLEMPFEVLLMKGGSILNAQPSSDSASRVGPFGSPLTAT